MMGDGYDKLVAAAAVCIIGLVILGAYAIISDMLVLFRL